MDQQIKKNFQHELDQIIEEISRSNKVPSLLLHSCCGPCSSYVVTYLMEYFRVTVLYYNPSIYPEKEYQHRLSEQARLLKELGVELLEVGYNHQEFLDYVRGLEPEPEGGARCVKCFEQRLQKTRMLAAEGGFDYFCTTLTVSPHKNAMIINRIGQETEAGGDSGGGIAPGQVLNAGNTGQSAEVKSLEKTGPLWLPSDFKKKDGYKKSIELSHQYDLYRQDYCGCEFSLRS